jgi:pyruvate kinase
MSLYWGVRGLKVGRLQSTDAMIQQVRRLYRQGALGRTGGPVVVVAGVPLNQPGTTNMISVQRF